MMKNKIGICFLTVIIILAVLFTLEKINTAFENNRNAETEIVSNTEQVKINKKNKTAIVSKELENKFVIKNENGMLFVYKIDENEKYFDTGIYFEELPENIQNKIIDGYYFENETDLYDFLESYSS